MGNAVLAIVTIDGLQVRAFVSVHFRTVFDAAGFDILEHVRNIAAVAVREFNAIIRLCVIGGFQTIIVIIACASEIAVLRSHTVGVSQGGQHEVTIGKRRCP